MRLIAASAILLLTTSFAHAAGCGQWTAGMEEDEGGPVMTARVCTAAGDVEPEFVLRCAGPSDLMIRFLPMAGDSYPPDGNGNFTSKLQFTLGEEKFTRDAHYEDMDGAMASDTKIDDGMVAAITSQKELVVSEVSGKVPSITFALKGSKAALEKLIATCKE